MGCGVFSDPRYPFQCVDVVTGEDMLCDGCRSHNAKAGESTGGEYTALIYKFVATLDHKWLEQADQLARDHIVVQIVDESDS